MMLPLEKLDKSMPKRVLPKTSFDSTVKLVATWSPMPSMPLPLTVLWSIWLLAPERARPKAQLLATVMPEMREDDATRSMPSTNPLTVPPLMFTAVANAPALMPSCGVTKLQLAGLDTPEMVKPPRFRLTLLAVMTTPSPGQASRSFTSW